MQQAEQRPKPDSDRKNVSFSGKGGLSVWSSQNILDVYVTLTQKIVKLIESCDIIRIVLKAKSHVHKQFSITTICMNLVISIIAKTVWFWGLCCFYFTSLIFQYWWMRWVKSKQKTCQLFSSYPFSYWYGR